jgi:hypothetical protein
MRRTEQLTLEPMPGSRPTWRGFFAEETELWGRVIKEKAGHDPVTHRRAETNGGAIPK